MSSIKRNITFGLSLLLVGCASAPAAKKAIEPQAFSQVVASYDEKTDNMPLDQVKSSCPNDSKWEDYDWKRVLPFANACIKAKDWVKLEKMGNVLATKAHLTPWGPYYLAVAAEGRKNFPRAMWMLELALKKAPKEGLFHFELARIHWELGNEVDAVKHMKLASDLGPALTEAHFTMGQIALQRRESAVATTYLQKVLQNDSNHLAALLGMATLAIESKDYVKAEEFLAKVVRRNPRHVKALLALAQVQEDHLKKSQEALQTYKDLKRLSADKKLDENVHINVDEKIQSLEKMLSQAAKTKSGADLQVRTPSAERKVQ